MHSRKEHPVKSIRFATDWEQSVSQLLNSTYEKELKNIEGFFEVFGMSYPNEILLVLTLKSTKPDIWPMTLKISADLEEKDKPKKLMDTLINSVGVYFDQYFSNEELEVGLNWEEAEYDSQKIWYLSSREDFGLTLEADRLLEESYSSL